MAGGSLPTEFGTRRLSETLRPYIDRPLEWRENATSYPLVAEEQRIEDHDGVV